MTNPTNLTFGDLVAAVCEATADQKERAAVLADLINGRKVRFTGHFARAKIEWVQPAAPLDVSRRAA